MILTKEKETETRKDVEEEDGEGEEEYLWREEGVGVQGEEKEHGGSAAQVAGPTP